jgi:hypothetical protein
MPAKLIGPIELRSFEKIHALDVYAGQNGSVANSAPGDVNVALDWMDFSQGYPGHVLFAVGTPIKSLAHIRDGVVEKIHLDLAIHNFLVAGGMESTFKEISGTFSLVASELKMILSRSGRIEATFYPRDERWAWGEVTSDLFVDALKRAGFKVVQTPNFKPAKPTHWQILKQSDAPNGWLRVVATHE